MQRATLIGINTHRYQHCALRMGPTQYFSVKSGSETVKLEFDRPSNQPNALPFWSPFRSHQQTQACHSGFRLNPFAAAQLSA